MLASALIGLSVLIVGLIMIYLTPAARRERSDLEDLRIRNAELERRVTELEARLVGFGPEGKLGA